MLAWLVLLQASLTIAVTGPATSPEYLPVRLAESAGYFAEEKLAVSLRTMRAEPLAAESLARGQSALAATSLDAALAIGYVGSVPPRLVFGLTAAPPVVLVVPAARRESIRTVADLAGKTVGIEAPGTPGELALMSLLLGAGLRIDQVKLASQGERGVAGAAESGAVDAAMLSDPWATRLLQSGKVTALADLRDADGAVRWLGQPTVNAALFVRPDTQLGSAELAPLCRALLRAIARIRTASPEELERMLPAAAVGTPEDFSLRMRGAVRTYLADGLVSPERFRASVTLVRTRRPLPAKVKLPRSLDSLLLMEPLREALAR